MKKKSVIGGFGGPCAGPAYFRPGKEEKLEQTYRLGRRGCTT
jgi:hypothetical protein